MTTAASATVAGELGEDPYDNKEQTMLIGETLHFGVDALTPWMMRPAFNAFYSVQLIAVSNTSTVDLEFEVLHRNSDETGEGTAVAGTLTTVDGATVPKTAHADAKGLKEQVRLRIKVKMATGDTNDWARFQLLNPSPYESAN